MFRIVTDGKKVKIKRWKKMEYKIQKMMSGIFYGLIMNIMGQVKKLNIL